MYKSKEQINKKLAQANYILKQIEKYQGKVFVNNGIDQSTGANPLQVNISSFLTSARSVLQYAYKECKAENNCAAYELAISTRPIIPLFRDLRDTEIHEKLIGTRTVISSKVLLFKTEDEAKKYSEENPTDANIVNQLTKPVTITEELVEQLQNEGKSDLLTAIDSGKSLYETVEFEGEKDLYILCKNYLDSLNDFVAELINEGAIT